MSVIVLHHCVKSVQIRSFSWSVFSRMWTEYGEILRIQPECGKIRTRKNSVFGHFSRSACYRIINIDCCRIYWFNFFVWHCWPIAHIYIITIYKIINIYIMNMLIFVSLFSSLLDEDGLRPATLLKKSLWHRSCEFCEISKNIFFYRTTLVASSADIWLSQLFSLLS